MSQLFTVGRVISGPELKLSRRQTPYTQFTLVERVGTGARARDQFIRVWAWGPLAEQLIHAGVREASIINGDREPLPGEIRQNRNAV